jgi:hypothetical protein
MNPPDQMRETTEHEQVRYGDVPFISITWEYGTRGELDRGYGGGGAGISEDVIAGLDDPNVKAKARRILELAEEWHLNTMQGRCAHQPLGWTCTGHGNGHRFVLQGTGRDPWQCDVCGRLRWDEPTSHCPVTGYRAGTSWLVKVPPAVVLDELGLLFEKRMRVA